MSFDRVRQAANGLVLAAALSMLPVSGLRAADRFIGFNNTTATVFTGVFLAPANSGKWGPNEALNDKDKVWDAGERLPIRNLSRGTFDLKVIDRSGRSCVKAGIDLTTDLTFEIRDSDLANCRK